jgi:predicted Zn-dependent protease
MDLVIFERIKNTQPMKLIFIMTLILMMLSSCATNPVTGRKQASTVTNADIFPQSFAAYNETLAKEKLSTNKAYNDQVTRVGRKIQASAERYFIEAGMPNYLKDYKWEYKVIESKELNAWCMPGGKVAFYTGIMPVCGDDAGLAVVMGHEIAHAIANHGAERMSQAQIQQTVGVLGAVALGAGGVSGGTSNLVLQAYGVGSEMGMLSYSRKHESEADEMGLLFMALAGYDPKEAPAFWKRMEAKSSEKGDSKPPVFLSTHPNSSTRVSDLTRLMPIAEEVYKTGSPKPYLDMKRK